MAMGREGTGRRKRAAQCRHSRFVIMSRRAVTWCRARRQKSSGGRGRGTMRATNTRPPTAIGSSGSVRAAIKSRSPARVRMRRARWVRRPCVQENRACRARNRPHRRRNLRRRRISSGPYENAVVLRLQLACQRGGGGDAGVAGKARGKIGQQGPRDTRGSAPGGGDPCNLQGGGGCFGSKGRVVGQARGDYVERFAVALQQQQPLDIVFCEPSEVAWVIPGGDTAAQPAVV